MTVVYASQKVSKIQSKAALVHMFEMDYQKCIIFPNIFVGWSAEGDSPFTP